MFNEKSAKTPIFLSAIHKKTIVPFNSVQTALVFTSTMSCLFAVQNICSFLPTHHVLPMQQVSSCNTERQQQAEIFPTARPSWHHRLCLRERSTRPCRRTAQWLPPCVRRQPPWLHRGAWQQTAALSASSCRLQTAASQTLQQGHSTGLCWLDSRVWREWPGCRFQRPQLRQWKRSTPQACCGAVSVRIS